LYDTLVSLPTNNVWDIGVAVDECCHDSFGLLAVGREVETVIASTTELPDCPIGVLLQNFGAIVD